MEVKADNRGKDDYREGSLDKFQSRNGPDEFDVRKPVDQSVFVVGQVRVFRECFCPRQSAPVGALQD